MSAAAHLPLAPHRPGAMCAAAQAARRLPGRARHEQGSCLSGGHAVRRGRPPCLRTIETEFEPPATRARPSPPSASRS